LKFFFKVNRDTAREDLNRLIGKERIVKVGAGNNVKYKLK